MVRPVIHSTKHYVQFPFSNIGAGVRENALLINAVAAPDKNISSEVEEGASIKAVFIEMWMINAGGDGTAIVIVEKTTNNNTGANVTDMASLFGYDNKKNILFTHQGLTSNDGIGNPIPVIRGWIKIPKSKQRFGLGDRLVLTISNVSAQDLDRCGFTTYKEYT